MADELIDYYDENMNHLGTVMKSQAHKEGLWHYAFHCWVVKRSTDGNHKIWLQLRSKNKDWYPNLLDISAAGHLQAGETAKDGIREIEEELGLKADFDKLTKLFTHTSANDSNGIMNREFNPTYLLETDKELKDLKLQKEEVDGIFEVFLEDMSNLINGKVSNIYVSGLKINEDGKYIPHTGSVPIERLAPYDIKYYQKVLQTIKRYFEGSAISA